MIRFNYFLFLKIFAILTLVSCNDTNEYRIDNSFVDYLHRFENEASRRGKNFDLSTTGLIIEFADLKDNTAGLTHYEDPIRIEIDQTYWNNISTSAGADLMKEDLLFHELGHGLLERRHLNSILENGDWKSMMCGGDKVNDRAWNINYRGVRREYYINELFDESTSTPQFSSNLLLVDTTGFSSSLFLSFNTGAKKDAGFDIVDNNDYKTSIDNGLLRFESKIEQVFLFFAITSINIQSDFSYELNLQYPTGNATYQYGLIFGTIPMSNSGLVESIEYFTINNNQKMYMGNRTWYSFFTELSKQEIIAGRNNKLKVIKINNMLYYFINNIYSYCSEIEAKNIGNHFGFMVPPKSVIWLENLNVSVKNRSGISTKMNKNQTFDFKYITIKSLNQNNIMNK